MTVILHAEDNPGHALLIKKALEGLPFDCEVRQVADGQAAVDYLCRQNDFSDPASSPRPDLVLLDLNLPKLKGLTVLKVIKRNKDLCDIPVFVLTTSDSAEDSRLSYEFQAESYLTKPGSYAATVKLLHQVVEDVLVRASASKD